MFELFPNGIIPYIQINLHTGNYSFSKPTVSVFLSDKID